MPLVSSGSFLSLHKFSTQINFGRGKFRGDEGFEGEISTSLFQRNKHSNDWKIDSWNYKKT